MLDIEVPKTEDGATYMEVIDGLERELLEQGSGKVIIFFNYDKDAWVKTYEFPNDFKYTFADASYSTLADAVYLTIAAHIAESSPSKTVQMAGNATTAHQHPPGVLAAAAAVFRWPQGDGATPP